MRTNFASFLPGTTHLLQKVVSVGVLKVCHNHPSTGSHWIHDLAFEILRVQPRDMPRQWDQWEPVATARCYCHLPLSFFLLFDFLWWLGSQYCHVGPSSHWFSDSTSSNKDRRNFLRSGRLEKALFGCSFARDLTAMFPFSLLL